MAVSPAFLIPLVVSAILGTIGGTAFRWSSGIPAWNLFIAMFLWTLIASAGTIIGRFSVERVCRGEWRRGLRIAAQQSVPLMIGFSVIAAFWGAPMSSSTLMVLFGSSIGVGLTVGGLGILTSPFRMNR